MPYEIISTGSKGNCIILGSNMLLDVGVSYKSVKNYLKDIKIIFISHRHSDHLNSACVKQIAYNYPTIKFICNEDVAQKLYDLGVKEKNIFMLKESKWYDIGFAKVRLEKLVHDAHNSSIQIEYKKNKKKVVYITDTGSVNHLDIKDYDLYLIESNYNSREEYEEKIKEAQEKGEYTHLIRVLDTHLSRDDAIDWLNRNIGENSKFQFIHQHIDKEVVSNE